MKKIVFDLDYTLLDTAKFKDGLRDAVTAHGPTAAQYEEAYKACVKREGKVYDYDPDVHLEMLRPFFADEASFSAARRGIDNVLSHTEDYLYDGSIELLKELRRHGASLSLMTLGNAGWQRAKVEHSGLTKMFDEVIATEKEKKEIMKALGEEGEEVIIVNDNGEEMRQMMEAAPEYTYILKRGPKPVPGDLKLKEAKDIGELAAILSDETGWELKVELKGETSAEKSAEIRSGTEGEQGKKTDAPPEPMSPPATRL